MNWSTDGQTPEFLAATRMISLADGIVDSILARLRLDAGMRVLDVGCGSGEYCFRLGSATRGVHYTGVELDAAFVEFANLRAAGKVDYPFEQPNPANDYRFACADGLDLPFDDGTFDAVVSHTYLTAVPDWACALAEMCRVCKPGGIVSSVTSLTDDFYGTGSISLFTSLMDSASVELLETVEKTKKKLLKGVNLAAGIFPRKVPVAFDWMGLENVSCAPLAHYFCLSDAATTEEEGKRHIELLTSMETSQVKRLKAHPETADALTGEQWDAYEDLVRFRSGALLDCSRNREWNWYGNASLLVCGTVPAQGIPETRLALREASRKARRELQTCLDAGLATRYTTTQLGPGRCVKTTFSLGGGLLLDACGFDPPRALAEACGFLLGNEEADYARIEARFRGEGTDFDELPAFSNADIYAIPDMWETVSETAMARIKTTFKDAGAFEGLPVVACIMSDGTSKAESFAIHPNYREAAMRAFARTREAFRRKQLQLG